MAPPLVLDIDGTLTRPASGRVPPPIDPRLLDPLITWEAPIVLATGKSFPYPVALAQFLGLDQLIVAETGGLGVAAGRLKRFVEPEAIAAMQQAATERGWIGDDGFDDRNYWRETELALDRELPFEQVDTVAADLGLSVVDSGYAYHVKDPTVSKGQAVAWVAETIDEPLSDIVAIGDSANDSSTFERVGRSFAVGNADTAAKEAADVVVDGAHADGTLTVLRRLRMDGGDS